MGWVIVLTAEQRGKGHSHNLHKPTTTFGTTQAPHHENPNLTKRPPYHRPYLVALVINKRKLISTNRTASHHPPCPKSLTKPHNCVDHMQLSPLSKLKLKDCIYLVRTRSNGSHFSDNGSLSLPPLNLSHLTTHTHLKSSLTLITYL